MPPHNTAESPSPLNCPHSQKRALLLVGMGNYWVCCHTKDCPCLLKAGIAKRKNYAIREWNRYVEKCATGEAG